MGQLKISCFAGLVKFGVAGVAGHSEPLQRSGCESPSKMHVVYLHFEENVANSYVAIAQHVQYYTETACHLNLLAIFDFTARYPTQALLPALSRYI
jgi:hypothetical protein